MISKSEFNDCMRIFLIYFGNDSISKDKILLYYEFLKNYSIEDLKRAFMKILAERVYKNVPQIAEIIMYLNGTTEKDLEISINLARETLKRSILKYGAYKSVEFEDKGIHAVIDSLGGWVSLCSMDMKEFDKFMTFEFPKIYRAYRQMPYKVSNYCLGYSDIDNNTLNLNRIEYNSVMENKTIELRNQILLEGA